MIRQQLFIGAALIAGTAIGFFVRPQPEKAAETAPAPAPERATRIEDKGDAATLAALRARVRELEARLAKARDNDEELVSNAVERLEVARRDRRREDGPREWMADLQQRDPERFAQMTNSFARWRQERKTQQAERASFLASVDTSRMSPAARKTHADYQNLLARREAIEEKLHDMDLSDEERREVFEEMASVGREMRQTRSAERQVLLREVARAVGLDGETASDLVQTVGEVYEATEDVHPGHGGPGRGDRGRGPGRAPRGF